VKRGLVRGVLRAIQAWDRLRLGWLRWRHPGLAIHPGASTNFASSDYSLAPGARLVIGPGAVTERRSRGVRFVLEEGACVTIGERVWLRSELGPVRVIAFAGAELEVAPEAFLNGCHVSAKRRLRVGRRSWIGPGSRVFDADQHDFDDIHPERIAPVEIGDHVWIASDVTVLRGVRIGQHSVVGARSVVTRDVPDHTLVLGAPARPHGPVGDRSRCR
jgi:carbonic anhydrase/acetyltransferase-like protein (isoleucine patch superfamily)